MHKCRAGTQGEGVAICTAGQEFFRLDTSLWGNFPFLQLVPNEIFFPVHPPTHFRNSFHVPCPIFQVYHNLPLLSPKW